MQEEEMMPAWSLVKPVGEQRREQKEEEEEEEGRRRRSNETK